MTTEQTARARMTAYLQQAGLSTARAEANIDALLAEAVPSAAAPPTQAALRERIAEAALRAVEAAMDDTLVSGAREEALAGITAVLPAPVDRTAGWLDAAAECNKAGGAYAERGAINAASAAFALMEAFLRKAGEAEYVATPCDFAACEPGGEPCSVHERLMAHAEGDHELCAPDCGAEWARRLAEAPQPETQAGPLPFIHTDDDGDQLAISAVMASTYDGEAPVVAVNAEQHGGDQQACVYVRPERVEQVVAALRSARQATEAMPAVVAQPGKEG